MMPANNAVKGYFITGTDTECGKTVATVCCMQKLQQSGLQVNGMKPVASGCNLIAGELRNADALQLQQQSSVALPYSLINPFAFAEPIAPHIAAEHAGLAMTSEPMQQAYSEICSQSDVVLVEGAGGWRVPLFGSKTWAYVVQQLQLQVILVVGFRLGCINHSLLTAEAILADGAVFAGWIGNAVDPGYQETEATMRYLQQHLSAPCLGTIPHLPAEESLAEQPGLELELLHCAAPAQKDTKTG